MNKLTENHFSFKCPMNWDEMEASDNGRFCNRCRKEVYDLTNCSIDEVIALQRKHGSICASIRVAQVAAVAVSLSSAACVMEPPYPPPTIGDQPINRVSLSGSPLPPEQLEQMKDR